MKLDPFLIAIRVAYCASVGFAIFIWCFITFIAGPHLVPHIAAVIFSALVGVMFGAMIVASGCAVFAKQD